jgi:hypothetical protein
MNIGAAMLKLYRKGTYKDAAHKAGAQRRELEITPCFAALLRWIVRLWTSPHKCLALALYQSPSQSL